MVDRVSLPYWEELSRMSNSHILDPQKMVATSESGEILWEALVATGGYRWLPSFCGMRSPIHAPPFGNLVGARGGYWWLPSLLGHDVITATSSLLPISGLRMSSACT